jgi:hypothetical protein
MEFTYSIRPPVVVPDAFVQEPVEDNAAEQQDRRQWQMMQAQQLVAELQWKTFVTGNRVSARHAGNS